MAYSSINANGGYEQSRRDDLESFGYMLIYLVKKDLPWMKAGKIKNKKEEVIKAYDLKKRIKLEKLCEGLPEEFIDYINYCRKLEFEQDPNYDYLRNLFILILMKENQINDLNFFWINKRTAKSSTKNYENNSNKKRDTHKRLYYSVKKSLEKNREEGKNDTLQLNNSKPNNSLNKVNDIQKEKNEIQTKKITLINGNSEKMRLINSTQKIKNHKIDNIIISEKILTSPRNDVQIYNSCLKNKKFNNFINRRLLNYNSKNQIEKAKNKKMLKISDNTGLNNIFNISKQNINNKINATNKNYSYLEESIYNKNHIKNIIFNHNCNISNFNKSGNRTTSNYSYYNLITDIHYRLKFNNIKTPNNKSKFGNYSVYSNRINEKNKTFQ